MLPRRVATYIWCFVTAILRLIGRLGFNLILRRPEPAARTLARTIAEVFESLGSTYLKLGQLVATRPDLLGQHVFKQLAPLFDQLPPIRIEDVRKTWLAEFGEELETRFAQFEPVPVASGSVASVFRGRLADGRTVAVKVRRPGIVEVAEADFRILRFGARLVGSLPPLRHVPVREAVEDIIACIRGQFDFRRETAACRRLHKALVWESGVVIPGVIDELCRASVVTMQFVDGLSPKSEEVDSGRRAALRWALQAFYRMVFVEGLVHCDLHPGNLHLLSDGTAVILDFGFTADLNDYDRLKFAEFFYAMATGEGRCCADIAVEMATSLPPNFELTAFQDDMAKVVDKAHNVLAKDFQVGRFVAGMFDVQRRHRVTSTSAFTMVALGLLVFEGLINQVDPELDFQRLAQPFIFRAS